MASITERLESPSPTSGEASLHEGTLSWSPSGVKHNSVPLELDRLVIQLSSSHEHGQGWRRLLFKERHWLHASLRVPGVEPLRLSAVVSEPDLEGLPRMVQTGNRVPGAALLSLLETAVALGASQTRFAAIDAHSDGELPLLDETSEAEGDERVEAPELTYKPERNDTWGWVALAVGVVVLGAALWFGGLRRLSSNPEVWMPQLGLTLLIVQIGLGLVRRGVGIPDAAPGPITRRWMPQLYTPPFRARKGVSSEGSAATFAVLLVALSLLFSMSIAEGFPLLISCICTVLICVFSGMALWKSHDEIAYGALILIRGRTMVLMGDEEKVVRRNVNARHWSRTSTRTVVRDGKSVQETTTSWYQDLSGDIHVPATLALLDANGRVETHSTEALRWSSTQVHHTDRTSGCETFEWVMARGAKVRFAALEGAAAMVATGWVPPTLVLGWRLAALLIYSVLLPVFALWEFITLL